MLILNENVCTERDFPFGPYRTTAQLVGTLANVTDITLCDIIVDKHRQSIQYIDSIGYSMPFNMSMRIK